MTLRLAFSPRVRPLVGFALLATALSLPIAAAAGDARFVLQRADTDGERLLLHSLSADAKRAADSPPIPLQPVRLRADGASSKRSGAAYVGERDGMRIGIRIDADGDVAFATALIDGLPHRLNAVASGEHVVLHATRVPTTQAAQCLTEGASTAAGGLPPLVDHMRPEEIRAFQKIADQPLEAVIAIDTDHQFVQERFGTGPGASAAADAWLDDLFLALNVIYQRDLQLWLVRGTARIRASATADPYVSSGLPDYLFEFGEHWHRNEAGTPRDFAVMLSGRLGNPLAGSGVAWIDQYCETGFNATVNGTSVIAGSYSVNMLPTSPSAPVEASAELVAHELGHNLGAAHTHCTNANPGGSFEPIDRCRSGETPMSGTQCYDGEESCPTEFGGRGTLMSYCSSLGCGERLLQFHPVHVALLNLELQANAGTCLSPATLPEEDPPFFADGFEAP